MRNLTALCLLALLCSGCSQVSLLTRDDYKKSQQDFLKGDSASALRDFPHKMEDGHVVEEGDFITTMEKAYLSLIQGKPEIAGLQRQAAALQHNLRYHVSLDGKTYFYAQTPEDYYPAEHEIIWLHLLLSWGYSQQAKYPEACNEAREARNLLSPPYNPPGHFDDPMLRIILGTLWTVCGEWREAQTDLRAAWALDNSLTWARTLAERDKPPAHLFVVLGGPGPEVELNVPASSYSKRKFTFGLRGVKSTLSISDHQGEAILPHLTPDAARWYERDLARDNGLHRTLMHSDYVESAVEPPPDVSYWDKPMTNVDAGLALGLVGGALLGAEFAQSDPAMPYGGLGIVRLARDILVGAGAGALIGATYGLFADYTGIGKITEVPDRRTPERYRYVRYLPEYVWVGWSDQALAYPVELRTPRYHTAVPQPTVNNNNVSVSVAHVVDAAP